MPMVVRSKSEEVASETKNNRGTKYDEPSTCNIREATSAPNIIEQCQENHNCDEFDNSANLTQSSESFSDNNMYSTVTEASDLNNENTSLAIPEGLAMDPLAPTAMAVNSDFMERIGSGLTLLKEHGKKVQKYMWKNKKFDILRKSWSSVVTVVLVEARDLPDSPAYGSNGVYCKCRLGTEIHKSKLVSNTAQPAWRERFNMHLYDEKCLELTVWHKGKQKNFMGRCTIDLSSMERDRTHDLWQDLECGFGAVHLLLTLSGAPRNTPYDSIPTTLTHAAHQEPLPVEKYAWYKVSSNVSAVGEARVTVHGARGLPASSLGARPLAVCVLELDNARVQTHAARAQPDPLWNHTYTFEVMDITSTLEVAVYDESIMSPIKGETLGKVSVPLLRINNGEKKWYALKDRTKKSSAKGNCPRILLEMTVVWNPIKASMRVLSPRETKYIQKSPKFDIPLIYNNLKFIKEVFHFLFEVNEFIKELFEWESVEKCTAALVAWLIFCYCFRLWMLPLLLLAPFCYSWATRRASCVNNCLVPVDFSEQDSEDAYSDTEKDDKTLKNRLNGLQDLTFTIKNGIDFIVSLAERIKNLTNFTVPYLSILAILMLVACSSALYFISINYLFMALGIYKFSRNLINPDRILNNDILDFISRVPDNEILKEWRELKVPEPNLQRTGSRRRLRT